MRAEMIRIMPRVMLPLPRTRAAAAGLAAGLATVALAGCATTSATYNSPLLALKVTEFQIMPESVKMAPGSIRIRLTNDGVLVHEVAIANADGKILGQTGAVFPGHTALSRVFTVTPGTYRVYDPGANYADLGAYGSLSVRSG
jgi:hypothetical protein